MSGYAVNRLRTLGLSNETAFKVAQTLVYSSLDACDPIWPANNSADAWRFIISGFAAAVTRVTNEANVAHNIYGPETWLCEQHILNATPSSIQYVCITDVELMNMPAATFLKLLDHEPSFATYMARLTSWRAQRDAEILVLVKAGNPALRTVIGLGMFFEAIAAKSQRPVTEDLATTLTLPVKQHILAQLCGVSRTSLWDTMRRLEEDGWLKVHYGRLELLALPAWRAVMRRRRESRSANMQPTIEQLLSEFRHGDMARPAPAHMFVKKSQVLDVLPERS